MSFLFNFFPYLGWLWVTAHRTGEQGMIFRELVEDLDLSTDPNTVFSWLVH
jgi:Ras GTPase-activating protein 1